MMTPNGGVFGRNPKFNSVTVENNLTVNGNFIVGTSGKGIDFSATANSSGTMTSELLNDYEEGTWTPTVTFNGASVGVTYSVQTGRYTKIGRFVTVNCFVQLTSKGTSTGNADIRNLPFAIASGQAAVSTAAIDSGNITFTDTINVVAKDGTSDIWLFSTSGAGVRTQLLDTDFANNSLVLFTFSYTV